MLSKLIVASARNPILIVLIAAGLTVGGILSLPGLPLDALPDLSDTQVIVFTEWPGRAPMLVEEQVTYPIVTALLGAPNVANVRGQSMFGLSFVTVIFHDGVDLYWARSRVLEYLQGIEQKLPAEVRPMLGPDATGLGWVFQYVLVDEAGRYDLAQLRSLQDWSLRYWLQSIPGVAEVAPIGGFVKEYQITVDPDRLQSSGISLPHLVEQVEASHREIGARVMEQGGREYMIQSRGLVQSVDDLRGIAIGMGAAGAPIRLSDVAQVAVGPRMRRGVTDYNGRGEVVGGIVIMRSGENALRVIERVKDKLAEVASSLPPGVKIVPVYDRAPLIREAIGTLREELLKLTAIVSLVSLLFLWHLPSALVVIVTLPIAILSALMVMSALKITANVMSLGGIAIAIGAMVDAAIIMVENAHKKIEQWQTAGEPDGATGRRRAILAGMSEVGPALFFALLVITVGFLPVFALTGQEGRLFRPLAATKSLAMLFAALLSITLVPVLMVFLIRGKIQPESKNPLNRVLMRLYGPMLRGVMRFPKLTLAVAAGLLIVTLPLFGRLGSEFMPPLNEGTILYMPTTLPSISMGEAGRLLTTQGKLIAQFPEVASVFGKMGEAQTATDPAPLNMAETLITLRPKATWRPGMTQERLVEEMDRAVRIPGAPNIWWQPIQTRIEMLATGVRSPLGIKILGPTLDSISQVGQQIEGIMKTVPGTRSAFFEPVGGGYYLDIQIDREAVARFGLTVGDVQDVIEIAVGGREVGQTIEGRERYPILVRFARAFRDSPEALGQIRVPTSMGAQVPLSQLAKIAYREGPSMVKNEGGQLAGFVFVDVAGRDMGGYVAEAKRRVAERVSLPTGHTLVWAGQYQYLERAKETLKVVVPVTLAIVFLLLYLNTRSIPMTLIILLAIPFSLIGATLILWGLDYHLSVAVWVGIIALAGVDAETGVVMLLYLEEAHTRWQREGRLRTAGDLAEVVYEGAVLRLRPKLMTVVTIVAGLLPILWSTGTGADVMKRIAAPMVGGMVSSTLLELLVLPVVYFLWRRRAID
jgi:Cu(I)/Ag(I) efflux system membrane protein CusA/SilA